MTRTAAQRRGDAGECAAADYLEMLGYAIVERNYQVRGGEIDIIAWHDKVHHGRTLCFVEVKTRGANDGSAERATDHAKLERIFHAAKAYCREHGLMPDTTPIQFEQVSVLYRDGVDSPEFRSYVIPVD